MPSANPTQLLSHPSISDQLQLPCQCQNFTINVSLTYELTTVELGLSIVVVNLAKTPHYNFFHYSHLTTQHILQAFNAYYSPFCRQPKSLIFNK